jgi:hypothetical protein
MQSYNITDLHRNKSKSSVARLRSLRWDGPRFVRGRKSSWMTTVWALRPRRLADELRV